MQRDTLIALFTRPWLSDLSHLLLRVVLGVLLVYHGTSKVFDGMQGLASNLAELGWPWPTLQAFAASYIEFAGGILITVGLFTRPVSLFIVAQFTIITFVYHGADPFKVQEKAFMFLVMASMLTLMGPGRWSVDARLFSADASRVS
ncbi:MAG: DoxX family protein [Candidatus Kapabacteria bacterium]|nr:DoxX family protein [Candidatus Kapabacteria bacterium]